jgi:hypothetical protein
VPAGHVTSLAVNGVVNWPSRSNSSPSSAPTPRLVQGQANPSCCRPACQQPQPAAGHLTVSGLINPRYRPSRSHPVASSALLFNTREVAVRGQRTRSNDCFSSPAPLLWASHVAHTTTYRWNVLTSATHLSVSLCAPPPGLSLFCSRHSSRTWLYRSYIVTPPNRKPIGSLPRPV